MVQVCAKLIQVEGHWNHWSGDLQEMMADELGDLLAAIDFVIEKAPVGLSRPAIQKRRAEKLALFRKWHDTQDTKP